jgi:hypothetical protein
LGGRDAELIWLLRVFTLRAIPIRAENSANWSLKVEAQSGGRAILAARADGICKNIRNVRISVRMPRPWNPSDGLRRSEVRIADNVAALATATSRLFASAWETVTGRGPGPLAKEVTG